MTSPKHSRALLEPEAIKLLEQHRITYVDHGLAHDTAEAVQLAERLGYPVVLKVVSAEVLHKSDVGGVVVDVRAAADVHQAHEQILSAVAQHMPSADIVGVLVSKQVPEGVEVIVGGLQDALFGATLMFGMGGIFTEVLRDVSFRIAPLTRSDALDMMQELQGYALLKGVRGQGGCDVEALAELLLSVSELLVERPDILELDLNPVRVYDQGLHILDARIVIKS